MTDNEHEYMIVFIRFFAVVFVLIAFIFLSRAAFGQPFECVATRIVDGDTLEVFCPSRDPRNTEKVRLIGLQTPERGERGCYKAAWELEQLALGDVTVERFGKDRYGRTLGIVENEKGCINVLMRKRWRDTKYDGLLTRKQKAALIERGWK